MSKEAEKFFNQGNAHFEAKEFDLAIQDYNQAIKLKPDFAEAFSNRGVAHGERILPISPLILIWSFLIYASQITLCLPVNIKKS